MFFRPKPPHILRESALVSLLPRDELMRLSQLGTPVDVAAGDEIIARSAPGRECFVIIDGDFEVRGDAFAGRITSGEIAGELALLTGKRRTASVSASSDSTIFAMHPREFATMLSDAPQFRRRVLDTASDRLGEPYGNLPAQILPDHERSSSTRW